MAHSPIFFRFILTLAAPVVLTASCGDKVLEPQASPGPQAQEDVTETFQGSAPEASKENSSPSGQCVAPAGTVTAESYWHPKVKPGSAWVNLAPWAFWSVANLQPKLLVELGTHNGYSYFAFDQAIATLKLPTKAYAVDTWVGDEHAGFYDETVYRGVLQCNKQYTEFSTLLRMTFDEAVSQFADGSIDLLHIDGRHFYEDVKSDFETWLPKLSSRSVVLFHDVDVHDRDFGVYRYWDELTKQYPHFTFHQWPSLGILGVGENLPEAAKALFATTDTADEECVQSIYSQLGREAVDWSAPWSCE